MTTAYASAPRLYVDSPLNLNASLHISQDAAHYLCTVLRLKEGNVLRVFNGKEGEFLASIKAVNKKNVELSIQETLRAQTQDLPVALAFAPLRKERLHFLIEKAVELGVTALYPVLTSRTTHRNFNEDRAARHIIEATEQCERLCLPTLHPPQELPDFLKAWTPDAPLFFCKERSGAEPLAQSLVNQHTENPTFFIGPEGGLATEESLLLESYPFVNPVSLGWHILRSETAALSALGFWQLYQKAQKCSADFLEHDTPPSSFLDPDNES